MVIAIPDTSCLVGLERIGHLEILRESYAEVVVPIEVDFEFGGNADWIQKRRVTDPHLLTALKMSLGSGEAASIALAAETSNSLLLVDDLKARKMATAMGVCFIGTIGLIIRAKKKGLVEEIRPILESLQRVDFRIEENLFKHALEVSGENL